MIDKNIYLQLSLEVTKNNSPILCHNILQRDLDHLDTPYNITMIDYMGEIMVIKQDEQEVVSTSAEEE